MQQSKPHIIYVYPSNCQEDVVQAKIAKNIVECIIPVKSDEHGVPLYKCCIEEFLSMQYIDILDLSSKITQKGISPLRLSRQVVGLGLTLQSFIKEYIIRVLKKIRKTTRRMKKYLKNELLRKRMESDFLKTSLGECWKSKRH